MLRFTPQSFLILILLSHFGLLVLFVYGDWVHIVTCLCVFLFLCSFSSTAIYHRLLSHRSWDAPINVEAIGTLLGVFTFTGTSITRTLSHRYHHKFTDTSLDPHSPKVTSILYVYLPMLDRKRKMSLKFVDDLIRSPFHVWVHRHYLEIIVVTLFLSFPIMGIYWTLAIFVAPGALCWMNISLCNIICHYGQSETIIDNRFLSWITFGEGWHRRHHDNPDDPNFGGKHWDFGYFWVKLFQKNDHQ